MTSLGAAVVLQHASSVPHLTVSGCPNSSVSDCAPSRLAVLLLAALPGAALPPPPPSAPEPPRPPPLLPPAGEDLAKRARPTWRPCRRSAAERSRPRGALVAGLRRRRQDGAVRIALLQALAHHLRDGQHPACTRAGFCAGLPSSREQAPKLESSPNHHCLRRTTALERRTCRLAMTAHA